MPRGHTKVPSFKATDLCEFILEECNGDITRLSKHQQARYYQLLKQENVFYYSADEVLLSIDSHLRFFEDWLEQKQNAVVGASR